MQFASNLYLAKTTMTLQLKLKFMQFFHSSSFMTAVSHLAMLFQIPHIQRDSTHDEENVPRSEDSCSSEESEIGKSCSMN